MSLSKLSKLPPEVLSSVLNNQAMPLRRRLHLRLLCNLWADIIEDALKKGTSLVVCDGAADEYYRKRKPDDLIIKSTDLTDEFTRPLSRLFPSLTQLSLNFVMAASWNAVPSLLAHLDTTNLTTVKLYGFRYADQLIDSIAIARALTALSRLTSLTLFGFRLGVYLLPHLKTVLSRLEKFACSADSGGIISSILSSSLSPRCTHLWLHFAVFQSFNSSLLVELSRNLTHLHLLSCICPTWQSISQMHSLSSLTMDFMGYKADLDSSLFSHLGTFTRLTQVKLLQLLYRAPLALPSKKETPLSSIKRLTLEVQFGASRVDYQTFFQAIDAWFPNLVKLTLLTWGDTIPGNIPAIRASLGKLSFSLEIGDRHSVDIYAEDF